MNLPTSSSEELWLLPFPASATSALPPASERLAESTVTRRADVRFDNVLLGVPSSSARFARASENSENAGVEVHTPGMSPMRTIDW